ncbi:MAG: PAS domain-containing protein, partial [Chloroflexota bacterium]
MSVDVRGDTSVAAAGIDEPSGPPPRRPTRGIRRFGQRWPHVSTAYRLLLLVVAVVLLWRLPWRDLSSLVDVSPELAGNKTFALGIFALVTSATAVLTLNYPGRADVSLLFLPVGLAWWHLGGAEATALAGLGALFGNVLRRVAWPASVVGAARLIISTAAGIGAATALSGGAEHSPFSTGWLVAAGVFFAAGSATDVLLDWLDEQWRGGIEPVARTDFLTNLLLVPLAVFFQVVNARLGFDRLAILLGGLVALLLVVRATVNLRTLHEALQQLHRAVDEEREKLSTLFLQSGEGIYTVDGELRIATVNPAMAELLGQPAEAIQGQTCAEVCHFEDRLGQPLCPDRCPLRQAQAEQRPVSQE